MVAATIKVMGQTIRADSRQGSVVSVVSVVPREGIWRHRLQHEKNIALLADSGGRPSGAKTAELVEQLLVHLPLVIVDTRPARDGNRDEDVLVLSLDNPDSNECIGALLSTYYEGHFRGTESDEDIDDEDIEMEEPTPPRKRGADSGLRTSMARTLSKP